MSEEAVELNVGDGGTSMAVERLDGKDHQQVVVEFGAAGTATRVSASDPLPVTVSGGATAANQSTGNTALSSILSAVTGVATAALQSTGNGILTALGVLLTAIDAKLGGTLTVGLPSGAATDTKQDTGNASLSAIDTKLGSALPLPATAATGAKQDTANTSLSSIDTKLSSTATAAKQPALGAAGTPSADVLTVQGHASMTALKVDASATTQPVSGTVAVTGVSTLTEQQTQTTALQLIDDLAHAANAALSKAAPIAGQLDDTGTATVTENNVGVARITAERGLHVQLRSGSSEAATAANPLRVAGTVASGAPAPSAPVLAGALASSTAPAAVDADDAVRIWAGLNGQQACSLVNMSGAVVPADATDGLLVNLGVNNDVAATCTQSGTWTARCQDGSGNALTSKVAGAERALSVAIVDGSGAQVTSFGGGTQYTEDVAAAADPVGGALIMVRDDVLSAQTTTDGDNIAARGTDKGELYVKHVDAITVTGVSTLAEQQTQTTHQSGAATSLAIIDDWDESDRAKVNPIVGQAGIQGASGTVSANTQRVVLATDVALPAGTNNIGDVDVLTLPNVTLAATTNTIEVVGDGAHDAAVAGNPVLNAGYASAAAPTDVGADGRAARFWTLRNGAQATVLTAAGALIGGDASNGLDVDITRLPASTNTIEVVGDVAAGVTVAGNPVMGGYRADTTAPTAVADGQAVYPWADEYGAAWIKPSLNQVQIEVTPTIDTAVYQSGDRLGSVMTFANAALVTGRSGTIVGAQLRDEALSAFDIRLHIFKVSPTLANADNGALSITDANLATAIYVGSIEFLSSNGHSAVDNRVVQGTWLGGPPVIPFVTSGSSSLFGVLEARGAYDAAATDDIVVTLSVVRD